MNSIPRLLIFLSFLIAFSPLCYGQQQDKEQSKLYREQADLIMKDTKAMDDAREIMVMSADFDTTSLEANYQAGYMHILTTRKDLAVKYFLRVYRQKPAFRFDLPFWIGHSYHYGLDFDNAIKFYKLYREKLLIQPADRKEDMPTTAEVDRHIEECINGKEFVAKPGNYAIINLGNQINSEFDDYGPVLSFDENEIMFTTNRKEGNTNSDVHDDNLPYEDIFTAVKKNGVWSKAKNIGPPVNNKFSDSDLALSPDGNTLFLYEDAGNGDIYFTSRQQDGSWTKPQPLPGINTDSKESSVSLTHDGSRIYFSSARPGGLGGTDIYYSDKGSNGEWKEAVNLGPSINTETDEEAPFIDVDGKTLFFSSRGGKGMGGFDIFKVTLINSTTNEWGKPENLGYPINTPDNDVFYVVSRDGKRGYYASVRDDGLGYSDIYMVSVPEAKPEPVVTKPAEPVKPRKYLLIVKDASTGKSLDARVNIQGSKDKVVVGQKRVAEGQYEFSITEKDSKIYQLSVESSGYAFINQPVRIKGTAGDTLSITYRIELKKLEVGLTKVLRNIYFDFALASFRQQSYSELNKLETMMKQNSNIKVEISGHTDNIGTKEFNKQLSQLRANAVRNFLVSKGVDPRRITTMGYGEERPLVSNDDEKEGREFNRRVEFKVTGN